MTRAALGLLVFTVVIAWPRIADACSCAPVGPPCEAVWQADAVFVGTVRMVERLNTWGETRVTLAVDKAFIDAPHGSVDVYANASGAACGRCAASP